MVNGLSSRIRGTATRWDKTPVEKGITHIDAAEDNKPKDIVLIVLSEGVTDERPLLHQQAEIFLTAHPITAPTSIWFPTKINVSNILLRIHDLHFPSLPAIPCP